MTPTLMGRWQTRFFLALAVGVLPTVLYMALFGAFAVPASHPGFRKLPLLLVYATLFGVAWDALYIYLQGLRWDRDWPMAFQFLAGLIEGLVLCTLFASGLLPGVQYAPGDLWRFSLHYGTIFSLSYAFMFGPMRVLFPRWRFRGGTLR